MSERLRLKNPAMQFPRDGFGFTDPRTKRVFNGMEGTPTMQAVKIIEHRRANPTAYPIGDGKWFNHDDVVQEIYRQKQQTMPELFTDYTAGPVANRPELTRAQIAPPAGLICSCGSSSFKPIYCPTCSGQKITGWKCDQCGKDK